MGLLCQILLSNLASPKRTFTEPLQGNRRQYAETVVMERRPKNRMSESQKQELRYALAAERREGVNAQSGDS